MKTKLIKALYFSLGTLSLALGVIGVIVPGLPTTPFLLLTAILYVKSSKKLYRWLISNRIFGPYILEYRKNKGLTKQHKVYILILMWTMVCISLLFFIPLLMVKALVVLAGFIGTYVVSLVVPTALVRGKASSDKAEVHSSRL